MGQILDNILTSRQVTDKDGNVSPLHSNTTAEQCAFLQDLIREVKPLESLEVGLAYGISTVAILDALHESGKPFHHTVIDPFQTQDWKNIGLTNIERAGYSNNIRFFEKFSDQVLPSMYNDNHRIQFAYIDSTKVFDILLTDVYFINKMLDVNGILVLDDCGFPGIRILVRFLSKHPSFTIYKTYTKDEPSKKVNALRGVYFFLLNMLPFKKKILPTYNFSRDEELGVNYNCIAFRKIREDDRSWDWHRSF